MGWTCTSKPDDIRQHLLLNVTFQTDTERSRPLDIAIVHFRTAYIAVETTVMSTGDTFVCAAVALMQFYPKDAFDFCTKWLDETEGPTERQCPERILKLLTPTPRDNDYSRRWRQHCWDNVATRKQLAARASAWSKGQALVYSDNGRGLGFANGGEIREFHLFDKRRTLFTSPGHSTLFRIPRRFWCNLQSAPVTSDSVATS